MGTSSEHDDWLPGVDIAIKPVRSYVYGALPAHILGYVGAPDDTNTEEARKYTFYQGDVEGKSNIEKTMNEYLRGQPGIRVMRRNAKGASGGGIREGPPKQGADGYPTHEAAGRCTKGGGLPPDDLQGLCLNSSGWQLPKNGHSSPEGYAGLAAKVAADIGTALKK